MKQQTAVEWLVKQLYATPEGPTPAQLDKIVKRAKAMEKEQIKDSFLECWKANVPDGIECKLDAEQYYKETFKSE